MYKISNDTSDNYTTLVDIITEHDLSGCSVLDLFTNYLGLQVLGKDFMEFVCDEYELFVLDDEEEDDDVSKY